MGNKVFYLFAALLIVCQVMSQNQTLPGDMCYPDNISTDWPCPEGQYCREAYGCNTRRKRAAGQKRCHYICIESRGPRTTTPDYEENVKYTLY
ncbi:hypothetical protein Ddc_13437 [Ditylenchus destructor]|nr:hypothetical protein Ddc_13437 [Ditylenchus destructor]